MVSANHLPFSPLSSPRGDRSDPRRYGRFARTPRQSVRIREITAQGGRVTLGGPYAQGDPRGLTQSLGWRLPISASCVSPQRACAHSFCTRHPASPTLVRGWAPVGRGGNVRPLNLTTSLNSFYTFPARLNGKIQFLQTRKLHS